MQRSILPRWLVFLLSAGFLVSGLGVATFAFLTAEALLNRPINPLRASDAGVVAAAEVEGGATGIDPLATDALTPLEATPVPTEPPPLEDERVTILFMGIDRRPGEPFVSRTDTMILLSVRPRDRTAAILSIPRDLYVQIPGRGQARINSAFVYGALGNDPAGGVALASQTVEETLGVTIDHYLLLDFSAFVNAIDAIGGIDVDVPVAIYDPMYPDMNYGYDPLSIPAGRHHFDGETALKYARTRHQDSDFGRAQRQQQVIMASRDKILSMGLGQLIVQAPQLYQLLGDGIRTDMTHEEIIQLAWTAKEIPSENIQSEVLDYDYVSSFVTAEGASVLILDRQKAALLVQTMFGEN